MKKYVILSYDIHALGGCQNYIYGKSQYLERNGWKVYVIFAGPKRSKRFAFQYLEKYKDGCVPAIDWIPSQLPKCLQNKTLNNIIRAIEYTTSDEITIESHHDKTHIWGELLAARTHGKHICFNCNELFRGKDKYFINYINFFKFKFDRKELFGIARNSISKLFDGYFTIDEQTQPFGASHPEPVQDIEFDTSAFSDSKVWNIAYIGRINKSYVDNVIRDLKTFALKNANHTINLVFIGDTSLKSDQINDELGNISNVKLHRMGNMTPIPLKLITCMNAIIAGAGCAWCSIMNGVPTIIPDPDTCMSNGIYGIETNSSLNDSPEKQTTFDISLSHALIDNIVSHPFFPVERKPSDINEKYNIHMKMIDDSSDVSEYFPSDVLLDNSIFRHQSLISKINLVIDYCKRSI